MTNHAWQEAVDLPRLAAWMDTHQLGSGPIADPVPLAGGTQNILLRLRRGEQGFVLRRPSLHAGPEIRATIGREARVLRSLANEQWISFGPKGILQASDDVAGALS